MRRFRLNATLFSIGCLTMAVLSGYLFHASDMAWGIVALLSSVILHISLISLLRKSIHLTSTFAAALENDDRTIRFDIESDDREIKEMTKSMNTIMSVYHSNLMELETRKLYYDRILRIMSHEMRNSITPIISLAKDFTNHSGKYDSQTLMETMTVIGGQAEGIKKFLDSYYNLAHLPEPKRQNVDAAQFCNNLRTLIALEVKHRGYENMICHYSVPDDMMMNIDSELITQAVMNLIRNSLDAIADVATPTLDITLSISDGGPFIVVKDNGKGLPELVRNNLFQPFITTKVGGSGIGLSLARQIARLHGGDLALSSSPRLGTIATLTLGQSQSDSVI